MILVTVLILANKVKDLVISTVTCICTVVVAALIMSLTVPNLPIIYVIYCTMENRTMFARTECEKQKVKNTKRP